MAEYVMMPKADYEAACNSIRAKTGKADKIKSGEMSTEIDSITGGGGSAEGCVTVTFMNGNVELFSRPVYIGDDCPDPIAQGHIATTPTKESTAQFDYTFNGWALTSGGSANSNALNNVTEDRTVYAAYSAAVKYYTVTWLDGDGTTVLKTESLAYGAMPNYNPEKEGQILGGWSPAVSPVVGDVSYVAQWVEGYSFAASSWADIARVAESGEAEKYFNLGDERVQNMGSTLGTQTLVIIGFNHDNLSGGAGKAGMTIAMKNISGSKVTGEKMYTQRNTILNQVPSDLKSAMKQVSKPRWYNGSVQTNNETMWYFSYGELRNRSTAADYDGTTPYEGVDFLSKENSTYSWWLRDYKSATGLKSASWNSAYSNFVASESNTYSSSNYMRFGFCI